MAAVYEESLHYVDDPAGPTIVRFYPESHRYYVTDPVLGTKNKQTSGATSLTGLMDKGPALMKWPLKESSKYLNNALRQPELVQALAEQPDVVVPALLAEAEAAHTKKAKLGTDVGTEAHLWVEQWSKAKIHSQITGEPFVCPELPEIKDPEVIEQVMARQSAEAAKAWFDLHDIHVHGAEEVVYSRKHFISGMYDADWDVTCTMMCDFCCFNGNLNLKLIAMDVGHAKGRYLVDFKSTNSSKYAPKGIYADYLAQCGVYIMAKMEEHPGLHYDGILILNGSKQPGEDKDGNPLPVFATHFSHNVKEHVEWAETLAALKKYKKVGEEEMRESNENINKE